MLGEDRKSLMRVLTSEFDPKRSCVGAADHSEIGWTDVCEVLSWLNTRRSTTCISFVLSPLFVEIGLRPELRTLFERLAIDPYSGLRIRRDGMIQASQTRF